MKAIFSTLWGAVKQAVPIPFGLLMILFLLAAFQVAGWFKPRPAPIAPVLPVEVPFSSASPEEDSLQRLFEKRAENLKK